MKICILMASPRRNGNTVSLLKPFINELESNKALVKVFNLYDRRINPCIACRKCQDVFGDFGCPQEDDLQAIFDEILQAETFILASPIYSWYCTPPMKSVLDRLVYGMNKYYGKSGKKECLWQGKNCAIISSCGYPIERGADIFEEGIKRYCKHSNLNYAGMLTIRDRGYEKEFMDEDRIKSAKSFANKIINY